MVRARVALGIGLILVALVALGTHRDWADGPRETFAFALAAGLAAAALLVWWAAGEETPAWASRGATAAGITIALLPALVHGVRVANADAAVLAELPEPIAFGRVVSPTLRGESTFSAEPGAVVLRAPAGSEGFLDVKRPALGADRWELPRALLPPGGASALERITWSAEIERDNTYFVVLDAEPLVVQLRPFDVYVQTRAADGRYEEKSLPMSNNPARTRGTWSFSHISGAGRAGGDVHLELDGRDVWSGRLDSPPRHLRLGETRTDREHGGTLRLTALRYERRVAH
ncbi:MAG TPA: hypothetical protein VFX49_04875 [Chloroflexota bacterium]|nr:hypothetical protein [Chloroflexota bacterium]